MATVITTPEEHPPEHDLRRAIKGHDEIMAAIAEHAAERAREIEAAREARDSAELGGSPAGPGTG